ncbi:uncharacterized protein LOC118756884 [Rhagoletis pomonella]|uniref:uncharacterized protein LOC118756884 n=2 Tax=Rhagoletis pomonella TaxID=28610 RepID=UPI00177BBF0E|nr:uncharacterized protein LOC118756884 [Rhagoletis pomonella]
MKHFTDKDYMRTASRPSLRRDAMPTIFEWKIDPAPVCESQNDSVEEIIELQNCEVGLNEGDKVYRPRDGTLDASTSPIRNCVYYDSDLQEVEVLKVEVETFKRENAHLKKETEKQCTELATLKRESDLQLKRHAWKMESLQKRLDEMAAQMKNVEDALASIFTKGQIAKLKSGSKRRKWAEEDIAKSISLYAASPKAYRLLYKRTRKFLRHYSVKRRVT